MEPTSSNSSGDGLLVTQTKDGRERRYRDLSSRAKGKKSVRYSDPIVTEPSTTSTPSSTSSSAYKVRPAAPTPPPAVPGYFPGDSPAQPADLIDLPTRIVRPDGSAVYDRPPSLDMPRAEKNERERPGPSPLQRKSSSSSKKAKVAPRKSSFRDRKPSNIRVDVRRSNTTTPSTTSSPGLSTMPTKVSDILRGKYDSAVSIPNRVSISDDEEYRRVSSRGSSRFQQAVFERRQQDEDDEDSAQARKELDRAEARARARADSAAAANAEHAVREASRERHLKATEAALEGRSEQRRREEAQRLRVEADIKQMERERAAKAQRQQQRESDDIARRITDEQLERDAEAHAKARSLANETRAGPSGPSSRPAIRETREVRPDRPTRVATKPKIHYPDPPSPVRRDSDALRRRGEEVIRREQARDQDASRGLSQSMSSLVVEADYEEGDAVEETNTRAGHVRRRERKSRRDDERERRRREFWD